MTRIEPRLQKLLDAAGAVLVREAGHCVFRLRNGSLFTIAKTPTDRRRALKNAVSILRRLTPELQPRRQGGHTRREPRLKPPWRKGFAMPESRPNRRVFRRTPGEKVRFTALADALAEVKAEQEFLAAVRLIQDCGGHVKDSLDSYAVKVPGCAEVGVRDKASVIRISKGVKDEKSARLSD